MAGRRSQSKMDAGEVLELLFSNDDEDEDDFTPKSRSKSKSNASVPKSKKKYTIRKQSFREDDICELDLDTTIYDVVKGRRQTDDMIRRDEDGKAKFGRTLESASRLERKRRGEHTPLRQKRDLLATPQSCPPLGKAKSKKSRDSNYVDESKLSSDEDAHSSSSDEEINNVRVTKGSRVKRKVVRKSETPKVTLKVPNKRRISTPSRNNSSRNVPQSCPGPQPSSRSHQKRKVTKRRINFSSIKEEDEEEWNESSGSDEDGDEAHDRIPLKRRAATVCVTFKKLYRT